MQEQGGMNEKVKAGPAEKERAARLAQALRDNLRKRKAQARQRKAAEAHATLLPELPSKGEREG
jgi:hypothetical protein